MKRMIALLFCLFLLIGCQREMEAFASGESEVSSPSSQGAIEAVKPAETAPSPRFEDCDIAPIETLEVYRYWADGKVYTHQTVKFLGEQNILSAVILASSQLPYVEEALPILGISREKAFVTVNFDRSFIDRYPKGKVYEILTTISMTLCQNQIADSICFTLNGEVGTFGEVYLPEPLVFAEGDSAEFAKIRAAIEYPGLRELYLPSSAELASRFGISMDETAIEIMTLLTRVGKMEHDAASPQELEPSRFYYHCVSATPYFSIEKGELGYEPSLIPITDSVSTKLGMTETMLWIGEHLQQTARLLCGDDFVLDLSKGESYKYQYFPDEGVVTPPHMGGGYEAVPLVLSYEATTDGYRAEVVYLFASMGGIGPWGADCILEKDLPSYVQNQAERAEVVVRRADDGALRFVSYRVKQ